MIYMFTMTHIGPYMSVMALLLVGRGCSWFFFFFFQAEDGIRDWSVTGVQTCALPISDHIGDVSQHRDRPAEGQVPRGTWPPGDGRRERGHQGTDAFKRSRHGPGGYP